MLKINFMSATINDSQTMEFAQAVKFEELCMALFLNDESQEKQNKIIANENGNYSEKEVAAAQEKLDTLKKASAEMTATRDELRPIYDNVLSVMTKPNTEGFSNDRDVVRTVLRVVACAGNSKFYKLAIIPAFQNSDLKDALDAIHVSNDVTADGYSTNSKERQELFKKASAELDAIMRDTFSLPVETPYTAKLRVKLNATDRKVINDVYVKGFSNQIEKSKKTDALTFVGRKYNTACKVNKDGVVDYSGLATDIAKLVLGKYSA